MGGKEKAQLCQKKGRKGPRFTRKLLKKEKRVKKSARQRMKDKKEGIYLLDFSFQTNILYIRTNFMVST